MAFFGQALNNLIAVECKKIHSGSLNSFRDNIKKANSQINKRIKDNLCTSGFIAIDLTCEFDHSLIREKTQDAFELFLAGYKKLNLSDAEATSFILRDTNFKSVIQGLSGGLLEFCFQSKYSKISEKTPLGNDVMGIFFQAESFLPLDSKENSTAIFQRFASYEINEKFADCRNGQETFDCMKRLFHSLVTGV